MRSNPLFFTVLITSLIAFSCARKEKSAEPEFLTPPDNYRLVEITRQDSLGNLSTSALTYNAQGKLDEENNVYDSLGRLIHSDWPEGRPYSARYVYNSEGFIDSIVTIGHVWDWKMAFFYRGLRLDEVTSSIYRQPNERHFRVFISQDEWEIRTNKGRDFQYILDHGRSPYPEEYRLKYMWYPWKTSLIFFDRTVKTIKTDPEDGPQDITNFEYEYNEYGYPVRMENLRTGEIQYFKYEIL